MTKCAPRLGLARIARAWSAAAVLALGVPAFASAADEGPNDVPAAVDRAVELLYAPAPVAGDDAPADRPFYLEPVVNPADKAADRARAATLPAADPRRPTNPFAGRTPSYELPAVDVVGAPLSALREEDRVGPYAQPRWTTRRFTPGTRVYVRPPGTVEFEYWLRPTIENDGRTRIRSLYEISVGLPHRLQLDLYIRTDSAGDGEPTNVGQQVELRYALADWGKIWGNPTIYGEWVQRESDPDQFEVKLLLGDEISPRWHWGVNLVAEMELGGEREIEYQVTGGLTYALIDSVLSVGVEAQWLFADVRGDRGNFSHTVFVGPTVQWRPFEQLRIAFTPLVGVTEDSPDFRAYINVGWEF